MAEGGNPFLDPESWHTFLTKLKQDTLDVMEKNKAMEAEMTALLGEE